MYVLLFIFYTIWILQAFGAIGFHYTFGFDDFKEYGLTEWLFLPLFCFGGLYCLYSVIKVLRGDSDCITSLKWALMYSFIYTFLNGSRAQIPTYNLIAITAIFLVRPLFYLGFYLWLCFSKGIKRRYPKPERKFAPSGWVWVSITFCLIGIISQGAYEQHKMNRYCKRVDFDKVAISDEEISDGYIAFTSGLDWNHSKEHLDTIYSDFEELICYQTMETTDSACSIILFSGRSEKNDARTHNHVLTKLLSVADNDIIEIGFCDSIATGKHLISTTFTTKPGLKHETFTVATIFDTESPKCIVLAAKAKGVDNYDWLKEIFTSLRWNLQRIPEAENQKNCGNNEDDISCRAGKCNQKANANMFADLLKRRTPGFLFCEMLLKHHEREITHGQGYYPFY